MQIDTVLFDLDDTLISTHTVFSKEIRKAIRYIATKYSLKYKEVKKFVDQAIINSYGIAKVNPKNSWPNTLRQIKEEFNISSLDLKHIENIFFGIYQIPPKRKRGVISILKNLKRNGIKVGLVTHASKEWTQFKLEITKLYKYFDHIEVVDTNRGKNGKDWVKGLNKLNSQKENTIVVGDNINGDIISSYNEGFRNLVWIKRVGAWKVYSEGEVPKGVEVIPHISKLSSILGI
jgi:HAD superfamily hydrolase (TIGR01549 family)